MRVSSIVSKTIMALTGLFLCFFLIVHVLGNLKLLFPLPEAQLSFNKYADFLSSLLVIKLASLFTFLCIFAHTVLAITLTLKNRRAAGTRQAHSTTAETSPWYSRTMGILGVVILVFLVIHIKDFWYPYKFDSAIGKDANQKKDLYLIVQQACSHWWYVAIYVISMVALGFHLYHGIYSGFRSLGLYHSVYARWLRWLGLAFSVVICGLFAAMPIYLFVRSLMQS